MIPHTVSSSYDIFEPRPAKANTKANTKAMIAKEARVAKGHTPFRVKSKMLAQMLFGTPVDEANRHYVSLDNHGEIDGTSGESTSASCTTSCTTLHVIQTILRHAKRHSLLHDDRTIALDDHLRALLQSPPEEKHLPLYLLPKRIYDTLLVSNAPPEMTHEQRAKRKSKSKTA
jgi:hypothetical protein